MTVPEKYNFWNDRTLKGYAYRYGSFDIKRRPVGTHGGFRVWKDFETQSESQQAWRELCDQATKEKA